MEESVVRQHAEAHGGALVEGDLRKAGGDLSPEAQKQGPSVMSGFPKKVDTAEVVRLEVEGDAAVTEITYRGEGKSITIESRWEERDGRPTIVDMKVV